MLLKELTDQAPNLRAIALHLQRLLLERADKMPGFDVLKLEPMKRDGILVSVILHLAPASMEAVNPGGSKRDHARNYKRSYTTKPHAFEVYSGPYVRFPRSIATISNELYDTVNHGIFLLYSIQKKPISFIASNNPEASYINLLAYEVGFEEDSLNKIVNEYANEWGR